MQFNDLLLTLFDNIFFYVNKRPVRIRLDPLPPGSGSEKIFTDPQPCLILYIYFQSLKNPLYGMVPLRPERNGTRHSAEASMLMGSRLTPSLLGQ